MLEFRSSTSFVSSGQRIRLRWRGDGEMKDENMGGDKQWGRGAPLGRCCPLPVGEWRPPKFPVEKVYVGDGNAVASVDQHDAGDVRKR